MNPRSIALFISSLLLPALLLGAPGAVAASADELAQKIFDRTANEGRVGTMQFTLNDARGRTRERQAVLIHAEDDEAIRIAIQFESPAAIRNTGFLSHDFTDANDNNWLYLPVTRRVRRIPTADRGDPFMGTDLTYGDIKADFRFDPADWQFSLESDGDGVAELLVGTAATAATARELGYSRFAARIDHSTLFPIHTTYFDEAGQPLKIIEVHQQAEIGHAWTAMHFSVRNLQTGHETIVRLRDMTYVPNLDPYYLTEDALADGTAELADLISAGR